MKILNEEIRVALENLPELPFSNLWIAGRLHTEIPQGAILHLGILSPLRSWNYMGIETYYETDSNQGGFGIDGNLSTLIGASLFIQISCILHCWRFVFLL